MTVKEKYDAIVDYCEERGSCHIRPECPLFTGECHHDVDNPTDDQINEWYATLFGVEQEVTEPEPTVDMVNHPSHYTQGGMECIDEMVLIFGKEAVKHFCVCNAWKYRKRAMFKNGQEDIDKSDWYIKKYKELSYIGTIQTL